MEKLFCTTIMNIMRDCKINKKCELSYNRKSLFKNTIKNLEKNNIDTTDIIELSIKNDLWDTILMECNNFSIGKYIWYLANDIEIMKILEKRYKNTLYVEEIIYIFNVISGTMAFTSMYVSEKYRNRKGNRKRKYNRIFRMQFIDYIMNLKENLSNNNELVIDTEKFQNSFYRQTTQCQTAVASIEHITYGKTFNDDKIIYGLKVKDTNFLISDILKDIIDNHEIYEILVKDKYLSKLSFNEYNTIFKITYLVLKETEYICKNNDIQKQANNDRSYKKTDFIIEEEPYDDKHKIIYIYKDGRNIWGVLSMVDFEDNLDPKGDLGLFRVNNNGKSGYLIYKDIKLSDINDKIIEKIKWLLNYEDYGMLKSIL